MRKKLKDTPVDEIKRRANYPTLEMAVEAARQYLEVWKTTKPWRDYLDACFAVACDSIEWGLEPKWSELVREVKVFAKPSAIRDTRFQSDQQWRP